MQPPFALPPPPPPPRAATAAAARVAATRVAATRVDAADAHAAVRTATDFDVGILRRARRDALASAPLWPGGEMPTWAAVRWATLRDSLFALDEDWDVWTTWYERRLAGGPFNVELEAARVLEITEEEWEAGPKVVNAKLKAIEARFALLATAQDPAGARFEARDAYLEPQDVPAPEDRDVADDPGTQRLHRQVSKAFADLRETGDGVIEGLGNVSHLRRLPRLIKEATELFSGDAAVVAARPQDAFAVSIRFGAMLETDAELAQRRAGGDLDAEPTMPTALRADLAVFVQLLAPYIRQYPTIRSLDEEHARQRYDSDTIATAKRLFETVERLEVMQEKFAQMFQALAEASAASGSQGKKSGSLLSRSARNICLKSAIILASFYSGMVGSTIAEDSVIAPKIGKLFLSAEREIVEIFADRPADIRAAITALLDDLKSGEPFPTRPPKAALPSPGPREDDDLGAT